MAIGELEAAGRGRWPGRGPAVRLKSRLPECQHLQASGPPGILSFAHMAADECASLRQEAKPSAPGGWDAGGARTGPDLLRSPGCPNVRIFRHPARPASCPSLIWQRTGAPACGKGRAEHAERRDAGGVLAGGCYGLKSRLSKPDPV